MLLQGLDVIELAALAHRRQLPRQRVGRIAGRDHEQTVAGDIDGGAVIDAGKARDLAVPARQAPRQMDRDTGRHQPASAPGTAHRS